MSLIEDARVTLMIADYAAADAANKLNIIGGGFQLAGYDFNQGAIGPQALVVMIELPAAYEKQQLSLSIDLRDAQTGEVVKIQNSLQVGEPQALRVQQVVHAERPHVPGLVVPDEVPARCQYILNLANGLPVPPGRTYYWQVELDGQHRQHWRTEFFVPGPPQPPVFGGPAGPAPTGMPQMNPPEVGD